MRLPRGGTLIGGWGADRTINVTCENPDPNQLYNSDQGQFDIPLRSDFKFIGTYPIAYGVQVGAVLQSYAGCGGAGQLVGARDSVPWWQAHRRRSRCRPGVVGTGYTGSSLSDPGSTYLPRWNQLDFSVRRVFTIRNVEV